MKGKKNSKYSSIKLMIFLIKLIQSLIKSSKLLILPIFDQNELLNL
jgi:hypothetical protein